MATGEPASNHFFLDIVVRLTPKSKKKFAPFRSAPLYVAIRNATILTPASVIYQEGEVLMADGRRSSSFSHGSPVTIPRSHTGFF